MQTYLVYREPKAKYAGAFRVVFVCVEADSVAKAIRLGKLFMEDKEYRYKAASAMLIVLQSPFYI